MRVRGWWFKRAFGLCVLDRKYYDGSDGLIYALALCVGVIKHCL